MTNKINKCDGNHGGPRCADPECWNDAPAPPAGGDVEVLGYWCVPKEAPLQGRYIEARHADLEAGGFSESFAAVFNVTELVDRAHVTQLKAEVTEQALCAASEARRALRAESELAKARELFNHLYTNNQLSLADDERIENFLSNQSAPDDKGQDYPEGKRERFQKWVLATKHPVLGFLDGHWLARGDDREGYASEYVQGLWVAYKAFSAEQPAPVAVGDCDLKALMDRHEAWKAGEANGIASMVMPDRVTAQSHWPEWKISGSEGWNACLDELARLNPIKQ